jgi:hypothetical protein
MFLCVSFLLFDSSRGSLCVCVCQTKLKYFYSIFFFLSCFFSFFFLRLSSFVPSFVRSFVRYGRRFLAVCCRHLLREFIQSAATKYRIIILSHTHHSIVRRHKRVEHRASIPKENKKSLNSLSLFFYSLLKRVLRDATQVSSSLFFSSFSFGKKNTTTTISNRK